MKIDGFACFLFWFFCIFAPAVADDLEDNFLRTIGLDSIEKDGKALNASRIYRITVFTGKNDLSPFSVTLAFYIDETGTYFSRGEVIVRWNEGGEKKIVTKEIEVSKIDRLLQTFSEEELFSLPKYPDARDDGSAGYLLTPSMIRFERLRNGLVVEIFRAYGSPGPTKRIMEAVWPYFDDAYRSTAKTK